MMLQTANETYANASNSINASVGSSWEMMPLVLLLGYVVAALFAFRILAPSFAKSQLLSRVGQRFIRSVIYAIKGLAATVLLFAVALPVYFVATADSQTQGLALRVVVLVVCGYVALVFVGVLADRVVSAFIEAHPEYDEWGDIFPEHDESDAGGSPEVTETDD